MRNSHKLEDCIKLNQKIELAKKIKQAWFTRVLFWKFEISILWLNK